MNETNGRQQKKKKLQTRFPHSSSPSSPPRRRRTRASPLGGDSLPRSLSLLHSRTMCGPTGESLKPSYLHTRRAANENEQEESLLFPSRHLFTRSHQQKNQSNCRLHVLPRHVRVRLPLHGPARPPAEPGLPVRFDLESAFFKERKETEKKSMMFFFLLLPSFFAHFSRPRPRPPSEKKLFEKTLGISASGTSPSQRETTSPPTRRSAGPRSATAGRWLGCTLRAGPRARRHWLWEGGGGDWRKRKRKRRACFSVFVLFLPFLSLHAAFSDSIVPSAKTCCRFAWSFFPFHSSSFFYKSCAVGIEKQSAGFFVFAFSPSPSLLPPTPSRPRPSPKRRLRQPLHSVPPPAQIHHRHARDLAHAPAEVPVARRDDVAPVRLGPLAEAVVGVRSLVVAGQPLQSGSLATRSATLYLGPSFSSSATTHSVTHGMHSAYRQSIMPWTRSILFLMEWLMKFVSTRTWYGGPRRSFQRKKREEGVASTWRTSGSLGFFWFAEGLVYGEIFIFGGWGRGEKERRGGRLRGESEGKWRGGDGERRRNEKNGKKEMDSKQLTASGPWGCEGA